MHFSRVKGNVKGGCNTELGRLTVITGVNGAGKSRIVNTLELAASAEASDIVGRARVRKGLDLLSMAPPDDTLEAYAETSEGKKCSLTIERAGKGKGKAPQHSPLYGITVEYPIRAALSALRGDTRKAQNFVLNHAGLKVSDRVVKKNIDSELRDLYDTFSASHEDKEEGIERLTAIREDASKIARASKAGATKAQALIDSLASDLPLEEPTDEEIEVITGAVRDANTAYTAATQIPETVDLGAMKGHAINAIRLYKNTEKAVQEYEKAAQGTVDPAAQLRLSMIPLLTVYASNGGGGCVLCESGHVRGETAQARITKIQSKVQHEKQRLVATNALPVAIQQRDHQKAAATAAINSFKAAETTENVDPAARQKAIAEAYTALSEAEAKLSGLTIAKGQWNTIAEARKRARDARKETEAADELVQACDKVLKGFTSRSRKAFIANVQQYLPESDNFDLVLKDGKRNVCMFGFRRGKELHTALSGAEWARLTIALGAACMTGGDNVLAVLTPEERAFDPATLSSVMLALIDAPGQIILTSPVEPATEIESWTHIRV